MIKSNSRAPITCTVTWNEVKAGGRKDGNVKHTVVPKVELRNGGFPRIRIVLLHVFAKIKTGLSRHF
jgi:hypothetical protein